MRWPTLSCLGLGLGLLASPAPAFADEPQYACMKPAPDAKLTIQFTPDLTLRDLGAWVTGFTCKSVVYDGEAAARASKLALIAPSAVTPRQAVQLFADTVKKAGLVIAEKADTFVISLDASVRRPCAKPGPARASAAPGACARTGAGKVSVSFKPDATLDDLAVWATGLTCKRVSFDPSIAAQATRVGVIVSSPLTPKQAARLFVDAVEATGLGVTERVDAYEVRPGPRWAHCAAAAPAGTGAGAGTLGVPSPGTAVVPARPADPAVDVDAVLAAGVVMIDDTHYEVKRAASDKIIANPMAFAGGARIVPEIRNGQPDGFKIFGLRPSSLFARIGLANGDTIQTFNGYPLGSADKALEAYSSLRTAQRAVLGIRRRGVPVTITITIAK